MIPEIDTDTSNALLEIALRLTGVVPNKDWDYGDPIEKGVSRNRYLERIDEYWKIEWKSRTINMELYAVPGAPRLIGNIEDEFFKWVDGQRTQMRTVVTAAVGKLISLGIPAHRLELPTHWRDFIWGQNYFQGLRINYVDGPGRVLSEDKNGRFVALEWKSKTHE